MCTYQNFQSPVQGSANGRAGWFAAESATVYFDHPVHAFAEHTLNIDIQGPADRPEARVALELTADAAATLARLITDALAAVPPQMLATSVITAAAPVSVSSGALR